MGRRRRTSYPIRIGQAIGTAAIVLLAFVLIAIVPHVLVWIVTGRWDG